MNLSLAFSPCPNDTFIFHQLATGDLSLPGRELRVHLADVETLNQAALEGTYDITKLSFHAYLMVRDRYRLLRAGAALGFGCGPLVVARRALEPEELSDLRIAIPGEWTTAHLLLRLWEPRAERRLFVPYDRIQAMVSSGEADCGVIIHESRFTYEQAGFRAVRDLGAWWEEQTGLPIPLGCIAIRRSLGEETALRLEELIREGIRRSQANPAGALPYMRRHAQELDESVLSAHVDTFVNRFSLDLGPQGLAAVDRLEAMAREAGLIP